MCSTCKQFQADIADAERRGDTRTASVKRALYDAHRRQTCSGARWAAFFERVKTEAR